MPAVFLCSCCVYITMQFATAQPLTDYKDLKASKQPSDGSLEVQSGGSCKRILKYFAGFVVLVSLVLATFSLLSFLLAQHFYLEIQSECYGRYESACRDLFALWVTMCCEWLCSLSNFAYKRFHRACTPKLAYMTLPYYFCA